VVGKPEVITPSELQDYFRICLHQGSWLAQLACCHSTRSGSFGFAICRFALFIPTAKIEGDGCASGAQLIRKSAVDHGPSHDHTSNGQRSYPLRCGAATSAILG
jgi:hypothetical protein